MTYVWKWYFNEKNIWNDSIIITTYTKCTSEEKKTHRSKYRYQLTQFQYYHQRRKPVHPVPSNNTVQCIVNIHRVHKYFFQQFSVPNDCIHPSYESQSDEILTHDNSDSVIGKEEISSAARKISVDTALEPDHVLMRTVNNDVCYEIIALIATRMLSYCQVPPCLTKARTILVHEGGDVNDLWN